MTDIRPEILEEVEACIRKIQAFLAANGCRIHRSIRRSPALGWDPSERTHRNSTE